MATWHNSPLTCVLTDLAQHGLAILTGGDRVVNAVRVDLGEGKEDNRPGGGGGIRGCLCCTGAIIYFSIIYFNTFTELSSSTKPGVSGAGKWGLSNVGTHTGAWGDRVRYIK